ncbi:hypothetical protein OIDMADRAFT_181647 [Oidiodendron maius Zn]|uniref:F-box domain-containing protein n=1 Tax=Oidiodendron maius (strain Zn) TaxID=913774 RepID=A0A0C3CK21_OIDMZ|nr:hypothetical protein OIDMADRAFT_181647 [Oidiodendron maius Zn]
MSTNFLTLPSELRNRVYELCVLHEEHLDPWTNYSPRQELTPGLLRANKAVHRETSSMFYAHNRFNFTTATPEDVASFLGTIGPNNADCIQHVCINFPTFRYLDPGDVTLEESSIGILTNIQSRCANLSTLTTSLCSTNAMALKLDALDYPKIATEALELVNTRFRAISSLQDIVVEVCEDGPSHYIRRKMESHGWTVSATEYIEELGSDKSFGDSEDDWDHDYDYGYDYGYDYD